MLTEVETYVDAWAVKGEEEEVNKSDPRSIATSSIERVATHLQEKTTLAAS